MSTAIVWFRRDLRLRDNPAWSYATANHAKVVPLFVIDPRLWRPQVSRRLEYLVASLTELDEEVSGSQGRLHVVSGPPTQVLRRLIDTHHAAEVVFNREVSPFGKKRDGLVETMAATTSFWGNYVHPPGSILTAKGDRYRVFTPFFNAWRQAPFPDSPVPGPAAIWEDPGDGIPALDPPPSSPGTVSAYRQLVDYASLADRYDDVRDDYPADATSHLSVPLKWGTISVRDVVRTIGQGSSGRQALVRQIAWRDFHAHLMDQRPSIVTEPWDPRYQAIEWVSDDEAFAAWTEARTGYPIVDGAMRQLAEEGWIHNRLRMVTASFLVKHLLVDWRRGERYFRRMLIDSDLSQNVGNWQWVAGSGADASPYFRVFNPVSQSKRYDPAGRYLRRWLPELRDLSDASIHQPWEADPRELEKAGIELGVDYPEPIIDHAIARERAIAVYRRALQ